MYSFDVFDTLITRKTATCTGIFSIMQETIRNNENFTEFFKHNFYDFRIQTELLTRKIYCRGEIEDITLNQIYETMFLSGIIEEEHINYLVNLEKDIELKNVIGIKENISCVKELLSKSYKVIAISDMYLDANTIRKMLEIADPSLSNVQIYVSSETKKTKLSGNMYRYIQRKENLDYSKWHHKGDNIVSDVQMAKQFGIETKHYKYVELSQIERNLLDEKNITSQLFIGASKNTLLMNQLNHKEHMGSCIGGIILFPYVEWIISRSLKKGIERLYFIARDGYILKKIADVIIKENNYNIKTKYVYGSRSAWRIPVINRENFEEILSFSNLAYIHNLKDLGNILGIQDYEILPFISEEYKKKNLFLSAGLLNRIINELKDNNEFWVYFAERNSKNRNLSIEYLKQEIDTSDDKFAFVELHGSGYTQICLSKLIRDFYQGKISNYYYTMDTLPLTNECIFNIFIPGQLPQPLILETLCRAEHGQTVGYRKQGDKVVPILDNSEIQCLKKYNYDEYINGVILFARSLSYKIDEKNANISLKCMRYIAETPDREVINFIGGIPFELTGYKKAVEFAPILSKVQMMDIYILGKKKEICYRGASFSYSEMRTGIQGINIDFYNKIGKNIVGKCIRIPVLWKRKISNCSKKYVKLCYGMEKSSNIVIYGAGNLGNNIYRNFIKKKLFNVVLWVDKWFEECTKRGLPVASPDVIPEVEFDYIVIAVVDYKNLVSIKEKLISLGVNPVKFNWINTFITE